MGRRSQSESADGVKSKYTRWTSLRATVQHLLGPVLRLAVGGVLEFECEAIYQPGGKLGCSFNMIPFASDIHRNIGHT